MVAGEEVTVTCIVPRGGGDCYEYEVTAGTEETGEKLKKRLEKMCGVPSDDMELFCKNEGPDGKQKWLQEDQLLKDMDVRDGATITVGIHGMKGDVPEVDPETGEMPEDAVNKSIASKGDASYYHAHKRGGGAALPEEHRIVSGGEPEKLGEKFFVPLEEKKSLKQQMDEQEGRKDTNRAEKPIRNYSWGDEKAYIKIYVSADNEPDAIAAAGDGKDGKVDVKWGPKYLKLRVPTEKHDLVLELDRIYYEILPEECKFRVSANKRITLTLKKKENYTWLKLLKPDQ